MGWGKEPLKQQKCTVLRRCVGGKKHLPHQLFGFIYWFYILLRAVSVFCGLPIHFHLCEIVYSIKS